MTARPNGVADATRARHLVALVLLAAACDGGLLGTTNRKPVAVAGDPVEAGVGETIRFDGSASNDPDGEVIEWAWAFGDGATADTAVATHAYAAAGTYTATLTVTDNRGDEGSATRAVTVVVRNAAPVAEIAGPNEAQTGTTITLDASGSSDADGTIASYNWDLGDGTTATGATVTPTYPTAGSYTVTLTVTDDDGATATAEHAVRVRTPPAVLPASSRWTWDLKNEADRPDASCGPFQAGPLTIAVNGASMTITESAGGSSVVYSGSYTAATRSFSTTYNGSLGDVQTILGTFDEQLQTFDGRYDVSFFGCNRAGANGRPVRGQRQ